MNEKNSLRGSESVNEEKKKYLTQNLLFWAVESEESFYCNYMSCQKAR